MADVLDFFGKCLVGEGNIGIEDAFDAWYFAILEDGISY
jgi:hypothetical protein